MWSKYFLVTLTVFCLLLAVGTTGIIHAEGSPYDDDPVGEEHPWGGDNYDDGGDGIGGDTTPIDPPSAETLPIIDGAPYYIQRLVIADAWARLSRIFSWSYRAPVTGKQAEITSRFVEKSSSNQGNLRGVRSK